MKIYFVRHGDTASAGSGKLTKEDQPLTPAGESQAHQAAHDLSSQLTNQVVFRILTSPRQRAHQTAAIIAQELKFKGSVETEPRLAERDCDAFEGQPVKEVFARPEAELVAAGMEPVESFNARARSLVEELLEDRNPGVVVLVSHSRNLQALMAAVEQLPRNAGLELEAPQPDQAIELAPQRSDKGQKHNDRNVDKTAGTYDGIVDQYISSNSELRPNVKGSLDRFASHLKPGAAILNVGCAGGLESGYLAEKGFTVSGCDISDKFIDAARKSYPDCDFFVADMRHLPGDPDSYNGIWCNAAFLHIPKSDAAATLKGFHKLLKPGGVLYLSVMRGDFDGMRTNIDLSWEGRHFSDYQPEDMLELLKHAGFTPLDGHTKDEDWGVSFLHFYATKS